MGQEQEKSIGPWTAKRQTALFLRVFKGATLMGDVARQHGMTVTEFEGVAGPVSLFWHDFGGGLHGDLAQPSGEKAIWYTMGLTELA